MKENEASPQGKPTTVHLEPEIRAQLDAYRARRRQSLSAAINYLLDQQLQADYRDRTGLDRDGNTIQYR